MYLEGRVHDRMSGVTTQACGHPLEEQLVLVERDADAVLKNGESESASILNDANAESARILSGARKEADAVVASANAIAMSGRLLCSREGSLELYRCITQARPCRACAGALLVMSSGVRFTYSGASRPGIGHGVSQGGSACEIGSLSSCRCAQLSCGAADASDRCRLVGSLC